MHKLPRLPAWTLDMVIVSASVPRENDAYLLPKQHDEKAPKLNLLALGAEIIVLNQKRAVSVSVELPFQECALQVTSCVVSQNVFKDRFDRACSIFSAGH